MRATRLAAAGLAAAIVTASGCAVVVGNETTKPAQVSTAPVKVIYHVSEGSDQATNALRNIRNHLSADPTAKISVLERRNIDAKKVIEEARLVPSGVAEVARLQAREGYVYLKP